LRKKFTDNMDVPMRYRWYIPMFFSDNYNRIATLCITGKNLK